MFRTLLKKEFLEHIYNRKYLAYTVISLVLIIGSFLLLQSIYLHKLDGYNDLRRTMRYSDHWRSCAIYMQEGVPLVFKPNKMQVFYQGVDHDQQGFAQIAIKPGVPLLRKESASYPVHNFFLSVDFTFIVVFILSLLVFAFSYDSVSREQERGTLKLVLSNSVPRVKVIMAKMFAGYFGVLLPFVMSFMVIHLISFLSWRFVFTGAESMAVALMFFCATVYLFLMQIIGVFISIRSRRSSTALAILMLVWILFIIVLHNLALILIEKVHKPPTVVGMEEKVKEEVWAVHEEIAAKALQKYNVNRWCPKPFMQPEKDKYTPVEMAELFIEYTQKAKGVINRNIDGYLRSLALEARLLDICSFCSPSLLFTQVNASIAGTGIKGRIHLYGFIKESMDGFAGFMTEKAMKTATEQKAYCCQGWGHVIRASEQPRYNYHGLTIRERVEGCIGYLGALLVLCVLVFMAAYLAFVRMELE